MNCKQCGASVEGAFCGICGACTEHNDTHTDNNDRFRTMLIDPTETVEAVVGDKAAQAFSTTGERGNGFALLTNKRVYFRGKCLVRRGRGYDTKWEESTVDVKDVTGCGFAHQRAIWAKVLRIIFLVISLVMSFAGVLNVVIDIVNGAFSEESEILFTMLVLYWGMFIMFHILYKKSNFSVFQISFAGGGIALDAHGVTAEEATHFEQQLQRVKQSQLQEPTVIVPEPQKTTPVVSGDIAQQLKEYKALFDAGVITEEEFNAKKAQLLNL